MTLFQKSPRILWPCTLRCQEVNKDQTLHMKMYYNGRWELRALENTREQLAWKIAIFTPRLQMFPFKGNARWAKFL